MKNMPSTRREKAYHLYVLRGTAKPRMARGLRGIKKIHRYSISEIAQYLPEGLRTLPDTKERIKFIQSFMNDIHPYVLEKYEQGEMVRAEVEEKTATKVRIKIVGKSFGYAFLVETDYTETPKIFIDLLCEPPYNLEETLRPLMINEEVRRMQPTKPNFEFTKDAWYQEHIAPFVDLWKTEGIKFAEIAWKEDDKIKTKIVRIKGVEMYRGLLFFLNPNSGGSYMDIVDPISGSYFAQFSRKDTLRNNLWTIDSRFESEKPQKTIDQFKGVLQKAGKRTPLISAYVKKAGLGEEGKPQFSYEPPKDKKHKPTSPKPAPKRSLTPVSKPPTPALNPPKPDISTPSISPASYEIRRTFGEWEVVKISEKKRTTEDFFPTKKEAMDYIATHTNALRGTPQKKKKRTSILVGTALAVGGYFLLKAFSKKSA